MALEPPEPDDSTRLSAADTVFPADSLHQFPSDLISALPVESDALLNKFCSIVQDEITMASRKLLADLVKGLKEIGHRTNQLEQRMDLATTMLEGHEEEVDRLNTELVSLQDKLEDA